MKQLEHHYQVRVKWTGNRGQGTLNYRSYEREHLIKGENKIEIPGSSDSAFRGDPSRYNPEELLVASLSACHMLWYLHLCAEAGIVVTAYEDRATGMMEENDEGGHFTEVVLHPVVWITEQSMSTLANRLHVQAHKKCFVANSVNFRVIHKPQCRIVNPGK